MATRSKQAYDNVVYDVFLWIFTVVVDIFFREIHPRSSWRIPRQGPIIFVAAPHANQFVDPLILMRVVRNDAHRRISFLIAASSMRRAAVGFLARLVGSVPVGRALDSKKPAEGKIYLPDPEGDPTLVKGNGVDFTGPQFMSGGMLILPSVDNASASTEIKEILGPDEIRLKKPFKGDVALKQLTGKPVDGADGGVPNGHAAEQSKAHFDGVSFSVAPHIDQSAVYDAVFTSISHGGCIGIFPEGGSHDRTELLPLKAGLAVMALGALAEDPDCGVCIVPVGMNYFHAHKFRSRCVVEFGSPITIPPELVEQYKSDKRRDAVTHVLSEVQEALKSVTLQAPDYETLFLIQAVRRLYNPKGKRLPLPMIIELQRRMLKGYETYKADPRIINLKRDVLDWHKQLRQLNVRDHQLTYAKLPWWKVFAYFVYRVTKLGLLSIAVVPGLILFSPVFIAGKLISRRKSKEALAASTVKIRARDVVATWKILVSLALGPALDLVYTIVGTYWTYSDRVGGRVPTWIPLWLIFLLQIILFPAICFAALRFGEIGMDILKSLRPLILCLNPTSSNTLVRLRARRAQLQEDITKIVNELGPELFPDFDHQRIISDPTLPSQTPRPGTPSHGARENGDPTSLSPGDTAAPRILDRHVDHIPRNESFQDIGRVGIFASRPTTPNSRSRPASRDGFKFQGFTALNSGGKPAKGKDQQTHTDLEEVSKNLHAAMRERGRKRKGSGSGGGGTGGGTGGDGVGDDNAASWLQDSQDRTENVRRRLAESDDMEPEEARKDI